MAATKEYTYRDVAKHNHVKDQFFVNRGKVYDGTKLTHEHPGGKDVLLDIGGQDGTQAFEDVGHSDEARETLEQPLVGTLTRQHRHKSDQRPRPRDGASQVMIVAVIGAVGVGKSTFIQHLVDDEIFIGYGSKPCTREIAVHKFMYDQTTQVHLIDTPGFNDSTLTDLMVMEKLSVFMKQSYPENVALSGIVYLHRIVDRKMQGSGLASLRPLRDLVKGSAYENIVLGTTMWENINKSDGLENEERLMVTSTFWNTLAKGRCRLARVQNTRRSALGVMAHFHTKASATLDTTESVSTLRKKNIELQMQLENILSENQKIRETTQNKLESSSRKFEQDFAAILEFNTTQRPASRPNGNPLATSTQPLSSSSHGGQSSRISRFSRLFGRRAPVPRVRFGDKFPGDDSEDDGPRHARSPYPKAS